MVNHVDSFDLNDKNVFITGAFGLFGQQLIDAFYSHGAKLTLCGHNQEKINTWKKNNIAKYNTERLFIQRLELTDTESIKDVVNSSWNRYGHIDILINNAAIDSKLDKENINNVIKNQFEDYPIEAIKNSVNVNLIGTIEMTQQVCKKMLDQGYGNIINVGSIYSIIAPNPALYHGLSGPENKPVDYIVSKSFIPNFTRYIATNYGKKNIRCNAIAPHGIFDGHDESFLMNFSDLSPLGRMCKKEELDGPFLFLASSLSSYINGITLVVDGGWTSW